MRRLKSSLLLFVIAAVAIAQTASQKPSTDVRRVGHHLACQCGCVDTVATCSMLECHFSKPAKERIAKMQAAGVSDQGILDAFIADNGRGIYRGDPNAFGWIVPYASILAGLAVIWWFVRRYRKPQAVPVAAPVPEEELAKYTEQIE